MEFSRRVIHTGKSGYTGFPKIAYRLGAKLALRSDRLSDLALRWFFMLQNSVYSSNSKGKRALQ